VAESSRPTDPLVAARSRGKYAGSGAIDVAPQQRERAHRPRGPPEDQCGDGDVDAYSIRRFCERHDISAAFFHKLRALGLGPVVMKVGTRTLISRESAAEWRRAREAETQQQEVNETPAHLR
jgi:hypothetical protein